MVGAAVDHCPLAAPAENSQADLLHLLGRHADELNGVCQLSPCNIAGSARSGDPLPPHGLVAQAARSPLRVRITRALPFLPLLLTADELVHENPQRVLVALE